MLWSCPWSSSSLICCNLGQGNSRPAPTGWLYPYEMDQKRVNRWLSCCDINQETLVLNTLLLCCDLAQVNLDLQLLCFCAVVLRSLSGDYWLTTLYFLVLFCFHLGQEALYWQTRLVMCNKVYGCLCVSSYLTMPCNKIVLQRLWNDHIDTDTLQIYSSDMTYSYYKVHE